MGDFTLPSLPPDFVPNFLTQPQPISNDVPITELLDQDRNPRVTIKDDSRADCFPKVDTNVYNFLDELRDSLNNLAQNPDREQSLSWEQWVECAALFSQSIVNGLVEKAEGMGATSFRNDISLESRVHLAEFAKSIERTNRYFQLPYDEHTTTNYCHKCLTAQGTTPLDWQAHLELCGHNATAARDSIHNQYIQELNKQMLLWYKSQRALVHDQIVLNITNDNFAPDILTADPRVREWARRVTENARERSLLGIDQKAKQDAEDSYQTALTQYQISHENDLERVRDEYQGELSRHIAKWQDILLDAEAEYQAKLKDIQERPTITDPTARKKRRGSVSAISSPIVTKAQPLQLPEPDPRLNTSAKLANPEPMIVPTIATPTPPPSTQIVPTDQPMPQAANPDPIAQLMNMMSAQFSKLTDRLDKIEAQNNNEYTSWETSWDANPTKTWQGATPRIDDELDEDAKKYANIDYGNPDMYDIPPNNTTYMAMTEDAPGLGDSDCVLPPHPRRPSLPRLHQTSPIHPAYALPNAPNASTSNPLN